MRGLLLFCAGALAGAFLMQGLVAQTDPGVKLNHIGINVKDVDAAVKYYKNTMGFRDGFVFKDASGRPLITYLQISKDTFLEIQPSGDGKAGITHFGLEAGDVKSYVARIKAAGAKVDDVTTSQRSGALLTNSNDAEGIRAELLEFVPGSSQRKAIDAWK
jgi:catechol 2,3-dioxygenase-like lactoylglutathione lyase family enzyme